jgi:hypothetical protein
MLWGSAAVALTVTTGCFPPDEGVEPDLNAIYFPTGLALSPVSSAQQCPVAGATEVKHKWLYVANSDFDLQYNAGTVQVFDLDLVDKFIDATKPDAEKPEDRCPATFDVTDDAFNGTRTFPGGIKSDADQFLAPGLCQPIAAAPLIKSSVKIGAFATDIRYLRRPDDQRASSSTDMLVVPIRGDRTLHWIDTNPNPEDKSAGPLLDCGNQNGACDENHRRGNEPAEENTRNAELPREPFGIAADQRGEAIVTTHQSDGALALFTNDWTQTAPTQKGPVIQFVLQDRDNIPLGAVGVVSIPEPDVALALRDTDSSTFYEPGYYATFRNSAQVSLVRYFSDQGEFQNPELVHQTYPERSFLELGGATPIVVNSQGFDSRGVAVDGSKRHDCECACDPVPDPNDCRHQCVETDRSAEPDPDAAAAAKAAKTALCDPNAAAPGACAPYVTCLKSCAPTPLGVYVSNRSPATLIAGKTSSNSSATSSDDLPTFNKNVPLQAGPSRVVIGSVRVPDGKGGTRAEGRIFVICFDSRQIFVYDPTGDGRIESVIRTGRGPHSLVVDETRGLGYVGHFTDSYIGVIDLDQSHVRTYGKMILSVGAPVAPRAQK